MLLTIDIGNTSIHFGIFDKKKFVKEWRIATTRLTRQTGLVRLVRQTRQARVIVSSVVPYLNKTIKRYFPKAVFVDARKIEGLGLRIRIKKKSEVGADRLVNALAAYTLYSGPAIVVDFGTATTFDVISAKGEYLGGAIAPGIGLSRDILAERTAKLPRIEIKPPRDIIGKSTEEAIRSGLVYGYVAMVEGMVGRLRNRYRNRSRNRIRVIATGGFAKLIAKFTKVIDEVDLHLTLKGLRIAGEKLCPKS